MTVREIQAEIREIKAEMKRLGLRVTSMMNRQEPVQQSYNTRLYALKLKLEEAKKLATLSVPEQHRRRIEAQTANMPEAMRGVM